MSANFQPIQLLQDISAAGKTGYLQVEANSVNWNIYFVEGRLQYADHSLQSLETIKHYLMGVAPDVASKITPLLVADASNKFVNYSSVRSFLKAG